MKKIKDEVFVNHYSLETPLSFSVDIRELLKHLNTIKDTYEDVEFETLEQLVGIRGDTASYYIKFSRLETAQEALDRKSVIDKKITSLLEELSKIDEELEELDEV